MSYSNFKDPMGLLKRMLLSGNKVAYSIIIREFIAKLLMPMDFLLRGSEKRKLKNPTDSDKPIILVLGGSRSGTTLLYQTLAHYLDVSYISNFTASFERSPITAFRLFERFIPKPRKSFQNYFGSVKGLGGPNDAFFLWNRWLGEDRNHVPARISEESKSNMKTFFNAWFEATKKPFLNKNNRNSICAPMFDALFPNILFVEIHRDPIFVAQSILLSRRTVQGSGKIGWGLLSVDSENSDDPLAHIDDICNQVFQVEEQLAKNREKIDPNKYIRISYEEFCQNPGGLVKTVGSKALKQKTHSKELENLQFSTASNGQRLNDEEFNRVKEAINKLYNKY